MKTDVLSPGCYTVPLGADVLWWLANYFAEHPNLNPCKIILPTQRSADYFTYLLYRKNPDILKRCQVITYESMGTENYHVASSSILWEISQDPELTSLIFQTTHPTAYQRQQWVLQTHAVLNELYAHEITEQLLNIADTPLRKCFGMYERISQERQLQHPMKNLIEKFKQFQSKIDTLDETVYLLIDGYIPPRLQDIAVQLSTHHYVMIAGTNTSLNSSGTVQCYEALYAKFNLASIPLIPLNMYVQRKSLIEQLEQPVFKPSNLSQAFEKITFIERKHDLALADEILQISKALFHQGEYVVTLVTPNRNLATYISKIFTLAGIPIDDSFGIPLSETLLGSLILNFIQFLNIKDHVNGLKLMLHSLSNAYWGDLPLHLDAFGRNNNVSWLETLSQYIPENDDEHKKFNELMYLMNTSFSNILNEQLSLAFEYFQTWGISVEILAEYKQIMDIVGDVQDADRLAYELETHIFRTLTPKDPHLRIMGPLEIKLIQPKIIILANMNEGEWPVTPTSKNGLDSRLRHILGLPSHLLMSSFSSKTFLSLLGCAHVYLCRTTHNNGKPTQPSRWWERLRVLSKLNDIHLEYKPPLKLNAFKETQVPCQFQIPELLRPKRISVSELFQWIQNPKEFIIQSIFQINTLPEWNAEPDYLDKGTIVHKLLEKALTKNLSFNQLIKKIPYYLNAVSLSLHDRRFWEVQIIDCIENFYKLHNTTAAQHSWTEIKGEWIINTEFGPITLVGKADRIDEFADGSIHIIDYKTGMLPSKADVYKGLVPQLPILGIMALKGAFPGIPIKAPFMVSYWGLKEGIAHHYMFDDLRHLEEHFIQSIKNILDPNFLIELSDTNF